MWAGFIRDSGERLIEEHIMRKKYKKRIRTFRDLVVYQKTNEAAIEIANRILPVIERKNHKLKKDLQDISSKIPRMMSEAHSKRFDKPVYALNLMMEVMSLCNEVIVILEQVKGLKNIGRIPGSEGQGKEDTTNSENNGIPETVINEIIRKYELSKKKILHLSRSWKKYYVEKK